MRKIALLISLFACITAMAQERYFTLTRDGAFVNSEDGSAYCVFEFADKSADVLYQEIKTNVMSVYKSAKDVLTENEPTSMSIRGFGMVGVHGGILGGIEMFGHYNILIQFKDGRVRVNAPEVDNYLVNRNGDVVHANIVQEVTFQKLTSGWFDKKGQPKKKKEKEIAATEHLFNGIIHSIIYGAKVENLDDNW